MPSRFLTSKQNVHLEQLPRSKTSCFFHDNTQWGWAGTAFSERAQTWRWMQQASCDSSIRGTVNIQQFTYTAFNWRKHAELNSNIPYEANRNTETPPFSIKLRCLGKFVQKLHDHKLRTEKSKTCKELAGWCIQYISSRNGTNETTCVCGSFDTDRIWSSYDCIPL